MTAPWPRRIPRLRLGEYLALAWLVAAGLLFLAAGRWEPRIGGEVGRGYFPFLQVFLLIVSVSLLRLALLGVGKLAATWRLVAGGDAAAAEGALGFSEEARLLRQIGGFVRDCAPLYLILFVYPTSDLLIDALQGTRLVDDWLIRADLALFGGHWTVWAERFVSPLLTELLSLCYFLHIVIPPLIVLAVGLVGPRALFVETIEGFVLISLLGVSLYVVFPAVGPYQALAHLYTRDLAGGVLQEVNRVVIEATRVPRDAFPSLHVGISALLLVYAFRAGRWLGLLVLPPIVGNWLATVYLRYHYTIDLVAGFLLAAAVYELVRRWTRRFPEVSPSPPA